MKIIDHPKRSTEMNGEDVFLIDGESGTQILPVKILAMTESEVDAAIREAEEKE